MEKSELIIEIAKGIKSFEELQKRENEIVSAVKTTVENHLLQIGVDSQLLTNNVVNAFAFSLKNEIGIMNSESIKLLERVRLVSVRTIQREKQKTKS